MFTPFTLNIRGELCRYERPQVMGIVNVTPDSFYSGSRTQTEESVCEKVERMLSDGVDFIDIGAYSSRSGADDVSPEKEMARLETGLKAVRSVAPDIPVSVDTFRAEVAKVAVSEFGADIINDISGGSLDSEMFDALVALRVPYILMHMRGTPSDMQTKTDYRDVTAEVMANLSFKMRELRLKGVSDIIIDPGFGFAKTLEQNYEMVRNLSLFTELLDAPLLVGVSRKSMLTRLLGITPDQALSATTALNTLALTRGAAILRVHDVLEASQAVRIYQSSI